MDRPVPWKSLCGALWGMVAKHRIPSRIQAQGGDRSLRRDALEIASSEPLNTSEQVQGHTYTRLTRQSHRCLDGPASTMEKPCGALWGMVAKQGNPSKIQAQGGASSVRRDALEIASLEPRNNILHDINRNYIQGNAMDELQESRSFGRWTIHRCLDEPEYRGKALWSTVGHGCETPDPQQDSSPRRCQKRAERCARNSIFGTAKYKAIQSKYTRHTRHRRQSHRCLDGPASTMEKPCGALWGMVACAEMLSK